MHFNNAFLTASLGMVSFTSAQKFHVVSVSDATNALKFSPNNVKAAVGDVVQFQFQAGNHSVVQSAFDSPCTPISAGSAMNMSTSASSSMGIFSGFQPVAASKAKNNMLPTFTVPIKDSKPIWIYCSQGKHCQSGMVMVINENTSANSTRSLTNYAAMAQKATANLSPGQTSSTGSSGSGSSGSGSSGSGSYGGSAGGSTGSGTGSAAGSASNGTIPTSTPATAGCGTIGLSNMAGLLALGSALYML